MIELESVYRVHGSTEILYDLLKERTPEQSISHQAMPTMMKHAEFVHSQPYFAWYIIKHEDDYVGSVYLTEQREIGIFIFKEFHGKGHATEAVKLLMARWPGEFLANINPCNTASIAFFDKFGAKHIQNTYEL